MPWYSFDRIAPNYDRTRVVDPKVLHDFLLAFGEWFPPEEFPRALEIGVGTGRMAFPFANQGYRVTGVDLSERMLARLRHRRLASPPAPVDVLRADATRLPFQDRSFDLAYWVHVLHLIPEWRRAVDEVLRTLRAGGAVIDLGTGNGREIPEVMRRYAEILRTLGHPRPTVGVRRRAVVLEHLAARGLEVELGTRRWRWKTGVPIGEALKHLDRRAYSATRYAPIAVHRRAMKELATWARARWGPPGHVVVVPNELRVAIARVRR